MKLTIVTPSLNQGAFLERTVRSVLEQRGDFELEYLVVDGGSTDGSLEILRRYGDRLAWTSEPDRGQSDALNKGFARATGDVLAWLNSDDVYLPGALDRAARALRDTGARWCFGRCRIVDEEDRPVRGAVASYKAWLASGYSRRRLLAANFIPQPAVFFRRDLLEEAGPLDLSCHYAMDYDLWLRFARVAEPAVVREDLAAFRWHGASKSGRRYARMAWEAFAAARRQATREERLPLVLHGVHVASLVAGYALLEAVEPVVRWGRAR